MAFNSASTCPPKTKQKNQPTWPEAGKSFTHHFDNQLELAAFLPLQKALVNKEEFEAGDFIAFDSNAGEIEIENNAGEPLDILLFGGEPYTEPIVAEGPFVMNNRTEIAVAYQDFYDGKYGEINKTYNENH